MEVLIIGGSRFSGRYAIDYLLKNGHKVTVLNRGQSAKKSSVAFIKAEKFSYPKNVEILIADRTKFNELENQIKKRKFDAIIDTCAFNSKDIQNIIDLAPKELEHYVFVSTASVYDDTGLIKHYPIPEDAPNGSEDDDYPIQYTRDKRRAESRLLKEYNENNFPITIIRPTYIYGPFNYLYREAYFFDRLLDNEPIYMPGNGDYITDFIFCKDLAWLETNYRNLKYLL